MLSPVGTVIQSLTANSYFLPIPQLRTEVSGLGVTSGIALQLTGITDTAGGFDGGTLRAISLGTGTSLTATPFATTGGGNYTVAAGQDLLTFPVSTDVGSGELSGTGGFSGFAYDVSTLFAVPVTVSGTTLGPTL